MISKKSDDAVSPIVGVMLMVVITVVIAAVITTFATGVATDAEAAPSAVFDVKIYSSYQALYDNGHNVVSAPDFHITQLSGDAVDTKDLKIQLAWENNGKSYFSTYSADSFEEKLGSINPGKGERSQPMYVKTQVTGDMRNDYDSSNLNYYFGDAVLKPGLKLTASADFVSGTSTRNKCMDVIFNNGVTGGLDETYGIMKVMPEDTAVQVTILHVPSNKAIFDKVVYVQ